MSESDRPFALRLYVDGEPTSQLMADYRPEHACPQWHYGPEKRYTWSTPEEALDFLTFEVLPHFPEFRDEDVRVVRVIPPQRERYVEVTSFNAKKG